MFHVANHFLDRKNIYLTIAHPAVITRDPGTHRHQRVSASTDVELLPADEARQLLQPPSVSVTTATLRPGYYSHPASQLLQPPCVPVTTVTLRPSYYSHPASRLLQPPCVPVTTATLRPSYYSHPASQLLQPPCVPVTTATLRPSYYSHPASQLLQPPCVPVTTVTLRHPKCRRPQYGFSMVRVVRHSIESPGNL